NEEEKELKDMPIWQNHEQRITSLEVTTSTINRDFEDMRKRFDDVEGKIEKGNEDQSKKLEIIDKRLMDEFFNKKNTNRDNKWKLILAVVGGGGVGYLVIEKIIEVWS